MKVWIAIFQSPSTESYAIGESPEKALEGLINFWKTSAAYHGADESYIHYYREEVRIAPVEAGSGIGLSSTDQFWPDDAMSGDAERLSDVWDRHFGPSMNP